MISVQSIIVPFLVAFIATLWIHPKVLKIAIMKNLVDNPDARKLQRNPTPVMGGIAVFFGLILGLATSQIISTNNMFIYTAAMMIMLYIGTIDDILSLSPKMRFIIEIAVITLLMFVTGAAINNFFGLWGVHSLAVWLSVPLTIIACVGIINAINLIDGVNGLSTGFCVMASSLFAIFFYHSQNLTMCVIAVSAAGAIIPFFLHNVFGRSSKMFIGEGGTLLLGCVMSVFVLNMLKSDSLCTQYCSWGIGLVPLTLAILCIPVFDTLRVMIMRILRGTSPFSADKTHLHHLFIEMGFSHIGTTVSILTLNCLVILGGYISYKCGANVNVQFYVVVALSLLVTVGLYYGMRFCGKHDLAPYRLMQRLGKMTHVERKGIFLWIQKIVDWRE